jgi:SAM-dependent methyltransferase
VGVDLSRAQLRAAAPTRAPRVQGDAERLPFDDGVFDLVFCDHGATTFARPEACVAEAARVLRPGGRLAFCMSTPIRDLCWDDRGERLGTRLARDYFALDAIDDGESVCFQRPYGAWIRLFRSAALAVEDLVELRPPADATTTYEDYAPLSWARRWPAEHIWRLRKEAP